MNHKKNKEIKQRKMKKFRKMKQNKLTEFTEVVLGSELEELMYKTTLEYRIDVQDELDGWNHITDIMMREYRDKDGNWKIENY
jgi:hypothetical protein